MHTNPKHYSVLVNLSDLHYGKTTPSFNTRLFESRLKNFAKAIVRLSRLLPEEGDTVGEIIVSLNGDLVDGESIYSYHDAVNQTSVIRQARGAAKILQKFIKYLYMNTDATHMTVLGTRGNHGRMSHEANPESNWDSVCIDLVEAGIGETFMKPVRFKTTLEPYLIYQPQHSDHKILIEHEGVKDAQTPAKMMKVLNKLLMTNSSILVNGHWHKTQYRKFWDFHHVVNGTIVTDDDYAFTIGAEAECVQTVLFLQGKNVYFHKIDCR